MDLTNVSKSVDRFRERESILGFEVFKQGEIYVVAFIDSSYNSRPVFGYEIGFSGPLELDNVEGRGSFYGVAVQPPIGHDNMAAMLGVMEERQEGFRNGNEHLVESKVPVTSDANGTTFLVEPNYRAGGTIETIVENLQGMLSLGGLRKVAVNGVVGSGEMVLGDESDETPGARKVLWSNEGWGIEVHDFDDEA